VAYIREVSAPEYDAEVMRNRGKLSNILKVHGIEPEIGLPHLALYQAIMFGRSSVTRLEREAIAVAVSTANGCDY